MLRRLIVLFALLAGVATATGLLVAAVAVAPDVAHSGEATVPGSIPGSSATVPSSVASASGTGATSATPASPAPVSSASASPSDPLVAEFHVGQPAPALSVAKIGGGTIDLAALAGRPVWLTFMGSYCPPCREELALMNGYAARYGPAGLTVVAVDVDEDEATVVALATSLKLTFAIGLDPDGSVERTWGAIVLPAHYWIDAQGIVRGGSYGGIGAGAMARQLQEILPGVVVTP